jgi:hypothetical protein
VEDRDASSGVEDNAEAEEQPVPTNTNTNLMEVHPQ